MGAVTGPVLSLFPGIGLLDMAFEQEGFCVVRGPDVLWGGDIRSFSPPAGVFVGIIGGPPCQTFSSLAHLVRAQGRETRFGNLIPEFERCIAEARPGWFLMENVPAAPLPELEGYIVRDLIFNNRWGPEAPEQNRVRRFSFGTRDGRPLQVEVCALMAPPRYVVDNDVPTYSLSAAVTAKGSILSQNENARYVEARARAVSTGPMDRDSSGAGIRKAQNQAVTAVSGGHGSRYREQRSTAVVSDCRQTPVKVGGSGKLKPTVIAAVTSSDGSGKIKQIRYRFPDACELQGLPRDFLSDAPFTAEGKLKAVANGVPLPMGRAIARAVIRALSDRP